MHGCSSPHPHGGAGAYRNRNRYCRPHGYAGAYCHQHGHGHPDPGTSPTATLAPTPTPAAQAEASRYVREMEAIAAEWEAFRTSADALITEVGQNFFAICFTRSGEIDQHIVTGGSCWVRREAVEPPDEVAEQHNRLLRKGEGSTPWNRARRRCANG